MRFSIPTGALLSSLALCGAAAAQPATVTFACPAQPTQSCFFVVFAPHFVTRANFELRGGATTQVPVVLGEDSYCYGVDQPVAMPCSARAVAAGVNR